MIARFCRRTAFAAVMGVIGGVTAGLDGSGLAAQDIPAPSTQDLEIYGLASDADAYPGNPVLVLLQERAPFPDRVEVVRTQGGVPHILAEDLAAMGYGLAWVMMEDYREQVPEALLQSNGRWGLAMGEEEVDGDFAGRLAHDFATETFHRLPEDVRSVYAGFAAGMNDFIRGWSDGLPSAPGDSMPSWLRPEFTAHDVAARDIGVWDGGAVSDFARLRRQETPRDEAGREEGESGEAEGDLTHAGDAGSTEADREGAGSRDTENPAAGDAIAPSEVANAPAGDAIAAQEGAIALTEDGVSRAPGTPSDSDLLSRWIAGGTRAGEADAEVGSNAWALAPERTTTGNAMLLRNPHLSWTAGYYEAHVQVPGVIDFYGDFRLGGPFTTIGGFNRRLGFATTNNGPVLEEIYALVRDPADADAYLFDGGSVAIDRRQVRAEFRREDGSIGSRTREMPFTPLGPIIHEEPDTFYVVKAHRLSQFRVGEQWLRMMQAQDFASWTEAMKIRAKVSSNLTYADADGVIHLVWNAATPDLPHAPSEYPVVATSSAQVWTELWPYEELPQLTNPAGGYVQNSNDPPYYTNLQQILPRERYPEHFPDAALRFRSQNSLELIDGDERFSLEGMVELKHAMTMTVADRMKGDLVEILRRRMSAEDVTRAAPGVQAQDALEALADWDNTASRDSRGSSLFELWVNRYMRQVPDSLQFDVAWSEDEPATTPRGVGDEAAAVEAFLWALTEAGELWGGWDVTWGAVHRIRPDSIEIDLPVGGCASALGCFRVVGFREDEDGRYAGYRGDGWVLAVEFAEVPRAYSVLMYGNSNRPASPLYYDQAEMFSENRMKPVAFTLEAIRAGALRTYRPGVG